MEYSVDEIVKSDKVISKVRLNQGESLQRTSSLLIVRSDLHWVSSYKEQRPRVTIPPGVVATVENIVAFRLLRVVGRSLGLCLADSLT
jgi:hypothetical protein